MYDITKFDQSTVAECGNAIKTAAAGASSMEDAANKIVGHLYNNLMDGDTSKKACALVRFYKTHPYDKLDSQLQKFAQGILASAAENQGLNCLTMLATTGDQPEWQSRATSQGHKAIPLGSAEMVDGIPMIAGLISQFGLDVGSVMQPDPALIGDLSQKTYNTFFVADAVDSPYIPAQDEFVIPFGIKSVLGIGGVLSSGELFVVIMFSNVSIPQATADAFKDIAPAVKDAVEQYVGAAIFA